MDKDLAVLDQKVDTLLAFMEQQQKQQQALDEFKADMIPIANHMIKLSIDELADIGNEFRAEDLLFLLKRVLRDTHLLIRMMDYLEGAMGFADEIELLGKQVFNRTVEKLDEMEHKGYFALANQGMNMLDQMVSEFSEEDPQALADNMAIILKTVRNMTQPDIMALLNRTVDVMRQEQSPNAVPSAFSLLRQMGDPQLRAGMARLINMLKTLGAQPGAEVNN
jgi:uncharacterized protein YjgD (DUF1641 family)